MNSHDAHIQVSTGNPELLTAFSAMSAGITRPKTVQRRLEDAARGRLRNPLGSYPLVAQECLEAGASLYNVTKPLTVMLAHLKRRYRNTLGCITLKERIKRVAKEDAESQVALTNLALAGDFASVSEIATADREIREEIAEKELLAEELESRLYGEKK